MPQAVSVNVGPLAGGGTRRRGTAGLGPASRRSAKPVLMRPCRSNAISARPPMRVSWTLQRRDGLWSRADMALGAGNATRYGTPEKRLRGLLSGGRNSVRRVLPP